MSVKAMDEREQAAWDEVDDSPCSWTWTITGPLLSDEERWLCKVHLGCGGEEVFGYGPTRAEAIEAALAAVPVEVHQ